MPVSPVTTVVVHCCRLCLLVPLVLYLVARFYFQVGVLALRKTKGLVNLNNSVPLGIERETNRETSRITNTHSEVPESFYKISSKHIRTLLNLRDYSNYVLDRYLLHLFEQQYYYKKVKLDPSEGFGDYLDKRGNHKFISESSVKEPSVESIDLGEPVSPSVDSSKFNPVESIDCLCLPPPVPSRTFNSRTPSPVIKQKIEVLTNPSKVSHSTPTTSLKTTITPSAKKVFDFATIPMPANTATETDTDQDSVSKLTFTPAPRENEPSKAVSKKHKLRFRRKGSEPIPVTAEK